MPLHHNKNEFRAAISGTANAIGLQEHIVEKDYWITMLLHKAATFEYNEHLVFKGGPLYLVM